MALPALVMVLTCCLAGMQVAGVQLRLQDAAAAAARSLARGDPATTASRLVPGATVAPSVEGDLVCATLTIASDALLGLTIGAKSCALDGGR